MYVGITVNAKKKTSNEAVKQTNKRASEREREREKELMSFWTVYARESANERKSLV